MALHTTVPWPSGVCLKATMSLLGWDFQACSLAAEGPKAAAAAGNGGEERYFIQAANLGALCQAFLYATSTWHNDSPSLLGTVSFGKGEQRALVEHFTKENARLLNLTEFHSLCISVVPQ